MCAVASEHEHAMTKFSRTSKRKDSEKVSDHLLYVQCMHENTHVYIRTCMYMYVPVVFTK